MSFLRNLRQILVNRQDNVRPIFLTHPRHQREIYEEAREEWADHDPKDRSVVIDVETSIRYMNSEAFKKCYGDKLIWTLYNRNKTRHFLTDTRARCIRNNVVSTASPCPVCRDMYLVLDYRNVKLLQQFICPHTGAILPTIKTGLCQHQQRNLIVSILRAKEYGTISYYIPFMYYDYEYYKELSEKTLNKHKPSKEN